MLSQATPVSLGSYIAWEDADASKLPAALADVGSRARAQPIARIADVLRRLRTYMRA
jgi:hypothetical protein